MNNEQTKTPGEVLWDKGVEYTKKMNGSLVKEFTEWGNLPQEIRVSHDDAASAVISHVLQGAKYVLLEPDAVMQFGDEGRWGGEWIPIKKNGLNIGTKVERAFVRRPISLPSGNSEGASTTQCASSGDAGADVQAAWVPKFKVGDEVRIITDGRTADVIEILENGFNAYSLSTGSDIEEEYLEAVSSAEPVVEEPVSIWKTKSDPHLINDEQDLPPLDAAHSGPAWEHYRNELGRVRAQADRVESERDQLRKELEAAQTEMAEARELMPIVRRQDFLDASLKEAVRAQLAFMNERLNYIHDLQGRVTDLTTDKAVLKEELKHASELEQNERAIRVLFENELKGLEQELTRLRSQLTWTPVSERLPEEKDADENGNVIVINKHGRIASAGWNLGQEQHQMWGHTHWKSQPLPFTSPPETEEQAMRREFEEWARSSHELRHVSYELTGLMGNYVSSRLQDAWLGYQAAKQSTKEQA